MKVIVTDKYGETIGYKVDFLDVVSTYDIKDSERVKARLEKFGSYLFYNENIDGVMQLKLFENRET